MITFSDLYTRADGRRFFADIPAIKADLACIGVVAKRGNWYPKHNLEAAASVILDHIRGYESRILYGGSMGGYAAIKYSALLGATQVIAFCPQWSIDAEECKDIVNPGWQEYFSETMRGMGVKAQDIGGRVFVFSDKYQNVDNFHYQMLAKHSSSIEFISSAPSAGNHLHAVRFIKSNTASKIFGERRLRRMRAMQSKKSAAAFEFWRQVYRARPQFHKIGGDKLFIAYNPSAECPTTRVSGLICTSFITIKKLGSIGAKGRRMNACLKKGDPKLLNSTPSLI